MSVYEHHLHNETKTTYKSMKFFEGMEHVETVKIYNPGCTCVKTPTSHHAVKANRQENTCKS